MSSSSLPRVVVLALLLGFGGSARAHQPAAGPRQPTPRTDTSAVTYRGGMVSPPLPKPKFTLTDTSGAPFDFWAKTQGRITLLFFGYTNCPDVCPMHMSFLGSALKKLPPNLADQFEIVFVTTDPAHDTPQVLRAWLNNFDTRIIGLRGSEAAVEAAQIAANVSPAKKTATAGGTPQFSHAAFVLAYTKDNLAHVIYPAGISLADWAHDLPLLAKETWTSH